jgi:hypothetical protein
VADNYFDSALLGFTGRVDPRFNRPELRELESQVLTVGLENQKYLMDVDQIESIKQTTNRPVYVDQFVRKAATNGTGFAAFSTGPMGASQRTALTWVCFTETWSSFATTGQDNDIKSLAIFDNEVMQTQRNLRERLRIWLMGQLHSGRTSGGNLTTPQGAVWNPATDAYEISDPTQFWATIASVMAQNKYYDKLDVFADPILSRGWDFTIAQGVNNAVNTNYQAKDFKNVFRETILGNEVASEYNNGMCLVLPENSFAFIPWLPALFTNPDSKHDFSNAGTYTGGYGTIEDGMGYGTSGDMGMMPERLTYGIQGWATQANNVASNGATNDITQQYQMGLYVAFQSAVLSNPDESTIYEFGYTG